MPNTETLRVVKQNTIAESYTIVKNHKNKSLDELDVFIASQSNGNFFQSPQYYEFHKSQKDYDTILIYARNSNNKIAGSVICVVNRLLPGIKFGFLSRAIVLGGPVIGDNVENKSEVMDLLLGELNKVVRSKSVYLEFRNLFDISEYRGLFEKHGLAFNEHLNFIIDSSDGEVVMSRMARSKVQQIKKSFAAGAEIGIATEMEEVKQFYQHLVNLYTKKVKKPMPKWSFFETFFKQRDKLGLYIIVKYQGKVIGGMMCPIFENRVIYDWYVAGEDRAYKNIYPSVMATWGAIDYAVKNNIPTYDFLGAGKPKHEYGVREFKAAFGGDLKNFGRYARILNQRKYNLSQWILKRLGYFK